ncbi:hypothetical protein EDD18DRAFT_1111665 [Armillaria luteobubalina]|uniref:Uncharacterized protein n=1 Tax=Armillaria luteobubalina TaxID=153913 RepID=A0AA39TFA6_9AGAR|nr:hypothetical protein EDD18DRAFT_1111665 [Armillaria luteobubalina]
MSISRFSNPHLLVSATKNIMHKDLALDLDVEESNEALIMSLNEKILKTIDVENDGTSRRRQKTSESVKEGENEQLHVMVDIQPATAHQVIPRAEHPNIYINAEFKWPSMPFPSSSKKLLHVKALSLTHVPCFMIAQVLQPVWKTHPPVPSSALVYHPYAMNAPLPPTQSNQRFIDIEPLLGSPVMRTK